MLRLEDAQQIVLNTLEPHAVFLELSQASGRILASDVYSPQHSPLFDNSAMDGFALSEPYQLRYRVVGNQPAGGTWSGELQAGEALRIMTGAEVPASASAVIPIEQVQTQTGEQGEEIQILAEIKTSQHIRRQGEEFKKGDLLLPAGTRLNPAAMGLLATIGMTRVSVYAAPRVAILATGSELLPPDSELAPGKLRDSNSETLAACVLEAGAVPVRFGILPDEPKAIRAGLTKAFESCDLVLTSGGVSVGDYDYVQEILLDMGLEKKFWRVAIKPGKPVLFGTLAGKALFGIPGNPASALTVFEVLVRPLLRQLQGEQDQSRFRPTITGRLLSPVKAAGDRLQLMRVIYQKGNITPLKGQGSSNLLTVARANALLAVHRDYAAGEEVPIWLLT